MPRAAAKNGLEHGFFSDPPSYITVGEPYGGKKKAARKPGDDADKPKPVRATAKGGKLFDEKVARIFKGEAYYDKNKLERVAAAKEKKRQMTYKFTPSGAGKETFSGPIPYFKPGTKPAKARKGKEPPNFYTRPGPKGTGSGYADVTLSKIPPHASDKYLTPYERELKERKEGRKQNRGEVFRPVGSSSGTFSENPYAPYEPPRRRKPRSKSAPAKKPTVPFRPTTSMSTRAVPGKSSHQHLFGTYAYKGDPYRDRAKTAGAPKKMLGPAFRPNPPSKSTFTRSISIMNATRSIHSAGP